MSSLKKYYIAILGETGVGKSTFINSLSNYMTYETFDEAKEANNPRIIISSSFQLTVKKSTTIKIKMKGIGPENVEGGLNVIGSSSTTSPMVYSFAYKDIQFNIIDVPGTCDTGGIERDRENKKAIIEQLRQIPEIHGIIMMFRSDATKDNINFKFTFYEILSCFHKNVQENIFFVLTYAGNTSFALTEIKDILEKSVQELNKDRNTNVTLNDRIFLIDNEPFRYLCGYNQSEQFRQYFNDSHRMKDLWDESRESVFNLLQKMYDISVYETKHTETLAKANAVIECCLNSVAQIMDCIAKSNTKDHREKSIKELMDIGSFNNLDLDVTLNPLVCVDEECFSYKLQNDKLKDLAFKQICHGNCKVDDVEVAKSDNSLLNCEMIDISGNCKCCKHHYTKHMKLPSATVKKCSQMHHKGKKLNKKEAETFFDAFIKDLNKERDEILTNIFQLTNYCNSNGILHYNNHIKEKIEIEIELSKLTNDDKKVEELEKIKKESELLETVFNHPSNSAETPATIIKKLFDLKNYGKTFKNLIERQFPKIRNANSNDSVRLFVDYIPQK